MSAVVIELSKDHYWNLPEAQRWSLGILADNYRRATPLRIIRPSTAGDPGWSLPVHPEDEAVMRGAVSAVAGGTAAYSSADDLRALLPSAGAR